MCCASATCLCFTAGSVPLPTSLHGLSIHSTLTAPTTSALVTKLQCHPHLVFQSSPPFSLTQPRDEWNITQWNMGKWVEEFSSEIPIQRDHQYTSQEHGHVGSNSPVLSETKSCTFIKTSAKCATDDKTRSRCVMTRSELGVKRLSALCKWSRTALLSLESAIRGKIPLGLKSFMCVKLPWVLWGSHLTRSGVITITGHCF